MFISHHRCSSPQRKMWMKSQEIGGTALEPVDASGSWSWVWIAGGRLDPRVEWFLWLWLMLTMAVMMSMIVGSSPDKIVRRAGSCRWRIFILRSVRKHSSKIQLHWNASGRNTRTLCCLMKKRSGILGAETLLYLVALGSNLFVKRFSCFYRAMAKISSDVILQPYGIW